jgi:hypothetical protein
MKRLTAEDIERMTTRELADLLANVVLVLRHLPDVPMQQLQPIERPPIEADKIAAGVRRERSPEPERGPLPDWAAEEVEEEDG